MSQKKFYITSAIPYVNAKPHIGTALDFLYADYLARFHRDVLNEEVYFLAGTDEHGQKIARSAEEKGINPQEHVDEMSKTFQELLMKLNISNDDFIRTTEERHKEGAQELWRRAKAAGAIFKKIYEGLYCVGCEAYKTEKELDENGNCPNHHKKPELISEENYFFKLSDYEKPLLDFYKKNKQFVIPQSRFNEIVEMVKAGLEDVSISRERKNLSWGVPVPDDDDQVMYVWFEALINYLSGVGFPKNKKETQKWWPADLHIIGKDINRFHSILWPAMLMASGVELPLGVGVHGFITVNGQKMSKSLGNVIDPIELVEKYGADPVRYFVAAEISFYQDGDFSYGKFEERYTADLANGIGNLLSRTTNMVEQYCEGVLVATSRQKGFASAELKIYTEAMQQLNFRRAVNDAILAIVNDSNDYIEKEKPWELAKSDSQQLEIVLAHLVYTLDIIQQWLLPFMPETAKKIKTAIAADKIIKAEPLFPRLEKTK